MKNRQMPYDEVKDSITLHSDLNMGDSLNLYCRHCEEITNTRINEMSSNTIKVYCHKCNNENIVDSRNWIKNKSEIESDYDINSEHKIGQKIYHKKFDEKGIVAGKTNDYIFVYFEGGKLKKLITNLKKR